MVDTEYRYELKYIISDQAAELLKQQLRALMELDSHSISDECSYTIRSLYFDDINSSAYYDKLDGIEYRSKYRMRIYNGSKDVIKLECKHKDENMTYKESSSLNYEIARAVIDGRYGAIRTNDAFMNLARGIEHTFIMGFFQSFIIGFSRHGLTQAIDFNSLLPYCLSKSWVCFF